MKKITLILMILVIASTTVSGQLSVYEPLYIGVNNFANASNVLYGLTPFLPDSVVQIIFNPARAHRFDKKFLVANIIQKGSRYTDPYYTSSPNFIGRRSDPIPVFSFAALTGTKTKWLFQIDNSVYSNESQGNSDHSIYYNPRSPYTIEIGNSTYTSESKNITTALKLSRISGLSFGSYSLGMFAITKQNTTTLNRYDFFNGYNTYEWPGQIRNSSYNRITDNDSDIKNSKLAIGIDFSLAGNSWDFVNTFTFQKSQDNNQSKFISKYANYDTTYYSDPYIDTVYYDNSIRESESRIDIENNPNIFAFRSYFRKELNLVHEGDQVFLLLDMAYAANNNITGNFKIFNYNKSVRRNVIYPEYQNSSSGTGKIKGNFSRYFFSAGYVLKQNIDNIFLLCGINPTIGYYNILDLSTSNEMRLRNTSIRFYQNSILKKDITSTQYSLEIPFYFNYKPKKWISLFGGINYSYNYVTTKTKSNNINTITEIDSVIYPEVINNFDKNTQINSYKELYLGMSLYHHSGFVAHIAFNNTLDDYKNWNISIGYHY